MAVKSVIEIDVLDEKFKSFASAFEKYQDALKKMPGDWQRVNAAAASASSNIEKNVERIVELLEEANKKTKDGNTGLKNTVRITGEIAKNMANAAFSAAKFLAYGALGSGFGAGALAASASNTLKQAQGLGITTGQLRAANVNLGRYIDPTSVLGNIADVQADLGRRQILTRLGAQEGQNPAEMLSVVMQRATEMFKAGGQTQQYAEAMGLTQIFSMQELRTMAANQQELNKSTRQLIQDFNDLALSDADSRAWQDFWVQLKRSGNLIETSFIKGLVGLTEPLSQLSKSIAEAIQGFLGSDGLKVAIEDFSKALKDPENKQAIQEFFNDLMMLGEVIRGIVGGGASFFRTLKEGGIAARRIFGGDAAIQGDASAGAVSVSGGTLNRNQAYIASALASNLQTAAGGAINPRALAGFLGMTQRESQFNPTIKNPTSSAYGLFQLLADRQKQAAAAFGKPYGEFSINEQIQNTIRELTTSEKESFRALLSAKTEKEGADAARKFYRYDTYMNEREKAAVMNDAVRNALGYRIERIEVSSTAGSDITASSKGLPR